MTGRLSVSDAEVKRFCFSQGEKRQREKSFESPEGFLVPSIAGTGLTRRTSEVPSLVHSEGSSRIELEDLEEVSDEDGEDRRCGIDGERGLEIRSEEEKRWGRVWVRPVSFGSRFKEDI